MTVRQKLGRNVLITIFMAVGLITILLSISGVLSGDYVPLGRLVLTLLLFYAVWMGHVWAGWLLVVLLFIGGLLGLMAAFLLPTVGVPLMLLYLGSVALLMAYKPIADFLDYQLDRRRS